MTVQCAIINQRSTIFASDTGVTTPDGKKYDGVQKIFKLSDTHPAKMMINGNMEFENIPLETIINEFTVKCRLKDLKTIEEIKNEFITFLHDYTPCSSSNEYISFTVNRFKDMIMIEIEEYGFDKVISTKNRKEIYPFVKNYSKFNDEFIDIIPKDKDFHKFSKILWEIFCFELRYEGTGIIIAGNNIDSPYPTFFEINIHCNTNEKVIYEEIESKIDFNDTIIRIYAMNEEGYAFFTGVNEEFIEYISEYLDTTKDNIIMKLGLKLEKENIPSKNNIVNTVKNILNEEFSDLMDEINKFRLNTINDTSKSIEFIPNNLLITLVDEIIRLTAIKQKISSENEYVSINSHISLMTKINGFKWVKFDDTII